MKKMGNQLQMIWDAKIAGRPLFAILIDPGKLPFDDIQELIILANDCLVDFIFVGGSSCSFPVFNETISFLEKAQNRPVIIFPGSEMQVSKNADALLLLSLISGRNPDLLIGKHVEAAKHLIESGLEVIPTGYILIESGKTTTVEQVSETKSLPRSQPELVLSTALAGQLLGMQLIYLEAGSGADKHVPLETIRLVSSKLNIPIIVGGGITDADKLRHVIDAGADLVVVGNALEKDPKLLKHFSQVLQQYQSITTN
jgi:putative glycerol-1-phosphate prenyltransferase